MLYNQHIKLTYMMAQAALSSMTLENTNVMNDASYSAWQARYASAKANVQQLRAILKADKGN